MGERGFQMSIQEVSAEQLAQLFHHYHQALAPDFGRCAPRHLGGRFDNRRGGRLTE
jgi:hypothetical protein